MNYTVIENYYKENRDRHVKRLTFVLGSEAAAEDVTHEAFYRAMRYMGSYNSTEVFGKWFSRILKNAQHDYQAAESTYSSMEENPQEEESYDCTGITEQVRKEVFSRIASKNPVAKEVLTYHIQYGYSPKDIANVTAFNHMQCHQIIHRFREELKKVYQ